jgi:hypothetical protein
MTSIAEIRQQYPQYSDMSDQQLADALHSKFYSDMPKGEYYAKVGLGERSAPTDYQGQKASIEQTKKAIDEGRMPHSGGSVVDFLRDQWGDALSPKKNAIRAGVAVDSAIDSVPVAGPLVKQGLDSAIAGIDSAISGNDYQAVKARNAETVAQNKAANREADVSGQIVGALGPMGAIGSTARGAKALGMTGSLPVRAGFSAGSGAAINGADTLARGGSTGDAVSNAFAGGLMGGAVPLAAAGIGKAVPVLARPFVAGAKKAVRAADNAGVIPPRFADQAQNFAKMAPDDGLTYAEREAQRRVRKAMERDVTNASEDMLGEADDASAVLNEQPVVNVDRGGETTRALLRSATNSNPEVRGAAEDIAQNRFHGQGQRAANVYDRIGGGNVDDVAMRESLKQEAARANRPAYQAAFDAGDREIWSPELERLSGSPTVQRAMRGAVSGWQDRAIADGFGAMNPGANVKNGQLSFSQGRVPVFPNLQFWDYTKKILDDQVGAAIRAGKTQKAATLTAITKGLRQELDNMVPEYSSARQGAAAFYGANDALDAGAMFAKSPGNIREGLHTFSGMKKAEKEAFKVGYLAQKKEDVLKARDSFDVIQRQFGSPAAREMNEKILGKSASLELEAFARVENIMNNMKRGLGNSTTARQLAEMGLAGGIGTGAGLLTGQDWQTTSSLGIMAVIGSRGARMLNQKVDQKIVKEVGKILLSNDPKLLGKLQTNAVLSDKWMKALQAIGMGFVNQQTQRAD